MELTKEEINHIANLARLELTEEEAGKFSVQISSILGYVKKLQEVNLSQIEPISNIAGISNITREDEVNDCDPEIMEKLIEMAPDKDNNLVKVNAVFGEN